MNNRRLQITLLLTLIFQLSCALVLGQHSFSNLQGRASVIRENKAESRWREIPWMTDGAAALNAASAQGKPLFVWVAGGNPFGRC